METKTQSGEVKVVSALASEGTIFCQMQTSVKGALFTFRNNGIEATFQIKEGGRK